MKKTAGILLAITLLITSACTVSAQKVQTLEYDNIIFEQNFNSVINSSSLNNIFETQTTRTSIEDIGAEHGNVVKLNVSQYDNMLRLRQKYVLSGYTDNSYIPTNTEKAQLAFEKIEADIYFDKLADMGIVLYADNGGEYVPISFFSDGSIRAGGQNSEATYSAETWYKMSLYLDYTDNTVTVYFGNNLLVANKVIQWEKSTSVNNLTKRFNFYVSPSETDSFIYIDNVKYSVPTLTKEKKRTAFSDTFENGINSSIYEMKYSGYVSNEIASIDAANHGKVAVLSGKYDETTDDNMFSPRMTYIGTDVADAASNAEFKHVEVNIDFLCNKIAGAAELSLKGPNKENLLLVKITADGTMDFLSNNKITYEANTWYSFKFDVDYENSMLDVYVNGELKYNNISFSNAGAYFARPYLYINKTADNELKTSVDNLKIVFKTEAPKSGFYKINKGEGVSSLHRLTTAGSDFNLYEHQNGTEAQTVLDFTSTSAPMVDTAGVYENNVSSQFETTNHQSVLKMNNYRMSAGVATYGKYDFYDLKLDGAMQGVEASNAIIETDISISHITAVGLRLRTRTSGNTNLPAENILLFDAKGNITKPDGTKVGKYEEGKWYSLRAYISHEIPTAPTVSVWLDGELLFENYTLTQQGNYVGRFGVGFNSNDALPCVIELDNFKMYADEITKTDVKNMCLIGASYSDENIVSISLQDEKNLDQRDYGFVTVSFDTSKAPAAQKYFMIWDGSNTLKPFIAKTPLD